MNKKLIRLTESDLHRIVKESVKRVLNESQSFKGTIASINELCNDLNMTVEYGQQYLYDGIPTLPVKFTANNVERNDIDEILDYLENFGWVSPPMPRYSEREATLVIKGEIMPSVGR